MELGSTVTLIYKGTLEDGTVFGIATEEEPMKFQTGMELAIDGFEEEILCMNEVGEKKTFVVDQYKAYGEYLDDYTQKVPHEQIPARNFRVGQRVWMGGTDSAPFPCTVMALEPDGVVFDMNHPLAGHDLTFEVEILEIEAAPEDFVSAKEKAKNQQMQGGVMGHGNVDGMTEDQDNIISQFR